MAIRLQNTTNTAELLRDILLHTQEGNRVMWLEEPTRGDPKMQAVRVRLSRLRADRKRKGKKMKHFTLHHSVHRHTEGGKRFDCVVVWRTKSDRHRLIEKLDDLVGHGDEL